MRAESAMQVQSVDFAAAKAAMDLPGMMALLDRVLLTSSEANQHNQFVKFVEMKMGALTPESYFVQHDTQFALVKAYVESAKHPGFMSLDVLRKGLLLHSVDQVFFKSVIDRIHDAMPALTASEVKVQLHAYALRHWDSSRVAAAALPAAELPAAAKALVASVPSLGHGSAVGTYNASLHSMCCAFCWGRGFRNTSHLVGACPFKAREEKRKARDSRPTNPHD